MTTSARSTQRRRSSMTSIASSPRVASTALAQPLKVVDTSPAEPHAVARHGRAEAGWPGRLHPAGTPSTASCPDDATGTAWSELGVEGTREHRHAAADHDHASRSSKPSRTSHVTCVGPRTPDDVPRIAVAIGSQAFPILTGPMSYKLLTAAEHARHHKTSSVRRRIPAGASTAPPSTPGSQQACHDGTPRLVAECSRRRRQAEDRSSRRILPPPRRSPPLLRDDTIVRRSK